MLLERETLREVEPELEPPELEAEAEPEDEPELLPFLTLAGIVVVVALLATALISICFLAAKLATGHAV
jgi:hypothetical protein